MVMLMPDMPDLAALKGRLARSAPPQSLARTTGLTSNLRHKFEKLTPRQQAAITAYRDALNSRADWMEAVLAALDAADLVETGSG